MTRTTFPRSAFVAVLLAGSMLVSAGGAGWAADVDDPGLAQRIEPDQGVADDDAVLDQGHVDIGTRYEDGKWTLMAHDDTRAEGSVWRRLDRTVLRVTDTAQQDVPDDDAYAFLGVDPGTAVHVVPQTQNTDVVWLGWNTQDPEVMKTVDRGVTLALRGVTGPGPLVVYLQDGGFGAPDVLWDSRTAEDQPFFVDVNTHTHANWVFSEPGTYLVEVEASATLVDGKEVADSEVLRFAVGDDTDPQDALTATIASTPDAVGADDADPSDGSSATSDGDGVNLLLIATIVAAAVLIAVLLIVVVLRGRSARRAGLSEDNTTGAGA